jgi:glycolate dehydrogenase FAD-binding subunit
LDILTPKDEAEATEAVRAAIANETPLEVLGRGTKRELGRPVAAALGISSAGLSGVSLYEPSELVLRAGSGTSLGEVVNLLKQRGQELAFEPMDYGPLFGDEPLSSSIGGVVAINASGPRRIKVGAARDHLLGFRAVSGRGEAFQSGGRVMKNVTGYDLSKLMTGSYGTLAFLTEVTLKVLPKAPSEATLIFKGLEDGPAISILTEASGLAHDASSLAHIPIHASNSFGSDLAGSALTAIRLEGPEISVEKRRDALIAFFTGGFKLWDSLSEAASRQFWEAVRDVLPIAGLNAHIWRISVAPTHAPGIVETLRRRNVATKGWYYDWAGGLIWLAVEPVGGAYANTIRTAVDEVGGHATLIRAPAGVRSEVAVFHPQPPALAALSARVKASFDPTRILNRGRLRPDL